MTLLVKFIVGLMGLVAAYFTLTAAVINAGDDVPDNTSIVQDGGSGGEDDWGYEGECVWDGSYDACGGSR